MSEWSAYFEATLKLGLNPSYQRLEPHLPPAGHAMDLGCGVGHATLWLAEKGFSVDAYDGDAEAVRITQERAHSLPNVNVHHKTFQQITFEDQANVITSAFALFFLCPADFAEFWPRMVSAIKPGGIFHGQLMGPQDTWASKGYSVHTQSQVMDLMQGFEILDYEEAAREGLTAMNEPKFWHIHHLVGKKLS